MRTRQRRPSWVRRLLAPPRAARAAISLTKADTAAPLFAKKSSLPPPLPRSAISDRGAAKATRPSITPSHTSEPWHGPSSAFEPCKTEEAKGEALARRRLDANCRPWPSSAALEPRGPDKVAGSAPISDIEKRNRWPLLPSDAAACTAANRSARAGVHTGSDASPAAPSRA